MRIDPHMNSQCLRMIIRTPSLPLRMSSDLSEADITALVYEDETYPEQVWYTIAAFLFVVGCFQWGSLVHSKFARRRRYESDEENGHHQWHSIQISLRRIPLAIINFYRVVAFRWTLEIGQSYTLTWQRFL
ncbi:uncharacterized protein BJ212DRAFT_949944 [Suillus subaureus]|uniref:Uncharacterized protein n=1 Tax=Suillus subaureus TaxID=48587 RepID=A0A9P7DVT4_9AGAM|nr:uncharacterized protein BJ212DRAFT_949944 [Suillus subaureus]KAG1804076.1 hypothetical protein BJ212DRAFT_949944 [Suillus subaureus]